MIQIGNAPCSWGVMEFDLQGKTMGFAAVLDEMKETGYVGTELGDWGFMPTHPAMLKQELSARGLSLVSAFVPVALKDPATHQAGVETALRTAHLLAGVAGSAPFIVLSDENGKDPYRTMNAGRIKPGQGMSGDEWMAFTEGVQLIAEAVRREAGLRLVFHHHCAGFIETPAEIDRLMALTDADLVGLCLDTGHCRFGGGDPLAVLQRHYRRIWHVHFKDCQPKVAESSRTEGWDYFESVRNGIFCELGRGEVDFPALKAALDKNEYKGWIVVEQDVLPGMGAPKESASRNRDYLKSIGY